MADTIDEAVMMINKYQKKVHRESIPDPESDIRYMSEDGQPNGIAVDHVDYVLADLVKFVRGYRS